MDTPFQTISTLAAPTITSVKDSQANPISNPGQTEDTALTLSGTADASSVLSIYNHSIRVGTASVTDKGIWTLSLQAGLGSHSFTVRAFDGSSGLAWIVVALPFDVIGEPPDSPPSA